MVAVVIFPVAEPRRNLLVSYNIELQRGETRMSSNCGSSPAWIFLTSHNTDLHGKPGSQSSVSLNSVSPGISVFAAESV